MNRATKEKFYKWENHFFNLVLEIPEMDLDDNSTTNKNGMITKKF